MTKRSNILAKVSLRDGLVSSWDEVRFGNSSNQQEKQTESRFVSLQTPRLIAEKARNALMYSQLPPPPHHILHIIVGKKAIHSRSVN